MRSLVRKSLLERSKLGQGGLTVSEIRDILGTSRKFAVPICEYMDAVGLTRRDGDFRFLKEPAAELAKESAGANASGK
jgi:selenocysteine-specific elongation factor